MRITSGTLGGRVIRAPNGIRPTQDKVRQALFNSLGEWLPGKRVLDLYAGSGALGLEAWSRGAESVTWVESHPRVRAALKSTLQELCGNDPALAVVGMDAEAYVEKSEAAPFDLVLADPPYRAGVLEKVLRVLGARPIMKTNGIFIFEQSAEEPVSGAAGWRVARDRTYGETRLITYIKES